MFIALLSLSGVAAVRRSGIKPSRRQVAAWWGGVAVLWIASDWPIGTLGSGYLASAHMFQYMLYTFVASPLLVLAVPERMAQRFLRRAHAYGLYRTLAHPMVAAVVANVVLLGSHAPVTVDMFRTSQFGSFALDLVWLFGGIVMWLPVCGPISEVRASYPTRVVYLFLAAGVVPMIPGAFITFADFPLYRIYELAPRVGSIRPTEDQQIAGAIMKIGSLPIVWSVMAAMFWRWMASGQRPTAVRMEAATSSGPPAHQPRMPLGTDKRSRHRPSPLDSPHQGPT